MNIIEAQHGEKPMALALFVEQLAQLVAAQPDHGLNENLLAEETRNSLALLRAPKSGEHVVARAVLSIVEATDGDMISVVDSMSVAVVPIG